LDFFEKKSPMPQHRRFLIPLRLGRRTHGAGIRASAALDAGVRVDHVLAIAFRDSAHGALGRAGTAGNALVRNLICHGKTLHSFCPLQDLQIIIHKTLKKARPISK